MSDPSAAGDAAKAMRADQQDAHNRYQRQYYETVERSRIALADSPYVAGHVDRMIETVALTPDHAILEIGAGLGKFTLPLVDRGYPIVANDLSPRLLERLEAASSGRIRTLCCDVHDIADHADARFDRVIGFFMLHHLIDFPHVFGALARVVKPGGRIAFCEPVGVNPLYYAQVLFTPGMTFKGERSLSAMRRSVILPAMTAAGFVEATSVPYGYFPPQIKNRPWGNQFEQWLEKRRLVPFPHAFQIFTARMPE